MRTLKCISLIALFIIPCIASAGKVHEYTLNNGLRLIVKEDHRAPVVVSEIWYRVGSSYEPNGITGVSHVLEHMMFQGTPKVGPQAFAQIIARNGGQENAFTYFDYTGYYQVLAADKLPISFKLEADRMQHLLLTPKAFKKEIQVVMEEWRMRTKDNPQSLTYERFLAAAHVSNPYHHTPIGWINDLRNMTVSDVKRWYAKWYAPNNATVVVVGDVNPKQVYKLAQKYFGRIPAKHLPVLKPMQASQPLGERTVIVKAPAKLPLLIMGYNVPVVNTAKEKWQPYALALAAGILDGGNSARFARDLIRKQQIATSAGASYDPFRRVDTLFILEGIPTQKKTIRTLKRAFFKEIKRLKTTLVTQKELARIKAQLVAGKIYEKDSIELQAQQIGSLESVGLSWRDGDDFIQRIEAITPEQVRDVARQYFTEDHLTVGILDPLPIPKDAPPGGKLNVH